MRLAPSADDLLFARTTRELLAAHCTPAEVRAGFSRDRWQALAAVGATALFVPEAHGGLGLGDQGLGAQSLVALAEEAGRACLPEPLIEAAVAAVLLAARQGPPAPAPSRDGDALLRGLADGAVTVAVSLPVDRPAGAPGPDGAVVAHAAYADHVLVLADDGVLTDWARDGGQDPHPSPDPQPHLDLNPRPDPHPDPRPDLDPHPSPDPQPHLDLNPRPDPHPDPRPDLDPDPRPDLDPDPRPDLDPDPDPRPHPDPAPRPVVAGVDPGRALGRVRAGGERKPVVLGRGWGPVGERAGRLGAVAAAADLLGAAAAMLERTVEYARQRVQFGRPIGSQQAVKHQLADVLLALEFARPVVARAAYSYDLGLPGQARDAAMAKVFATEAAQTAARTCLQVHGAIGYTDECDLSLWLRRVWALSAAWGDAAHHRAVVAADLLAPTGPSPSCPTR